MTERQMVLLFTLYLDMQDGGEGLKLELPKRPAPPILPDPLPYALVPPDRYKRRDSG